MTKANQTEVTAPAIDMSKLSVSELTAILAKARAADKELKAKAQSLPMFAYLIVMADSKLVYWAGRAETVEAAQTMAKAHAVADGGEVFDLCSRPLPQARGRKAKVAEG